MATSDPALRKAAVLLASLDEATAEALLQRMEPSQALRVRQAAAELEAIDPAEQRQVLAALSSGEVPLGRWGSADADRGVELDESLRAKLRSEAVGAVDAPTARAWQPDSAPPFGFLDEFAPADIVPALADEHPQIMALVVAHLSPHRAAEVLAKLPQPTQVDVVKRLIDLQPADPGVVREVELAIECQLEAQQRQHRARAAGLAVLGQILEAADGRVGAEIIGNVSRHDQRLGRLLERRPTPVTRLEELDDAGLASLVAEADPQLTVLALAGASEALLARVLRQFPPRAARRLEQALSQMGPTRLSDMTGAEQALLALAREQQGSGRPGARATGHLNTAA